ncbi:transposase [Bradyrhizobium sp. CCGUVB1N3]|uniref:transposase n=1 Tax=Bradyrhizobium sp. CCGUVB1N3 TaxID=2949629 RepID=UPI00353183E8
MAHTNRFAAWIGLTPKQNSSGGKDRRTTAVAPRTSRARCCRLWKAASGLDCKMSVRGSLMSDANLPPSETAPYRPKTKRAQKEEAKPSCATKSNPSGQANRSGKRGDSSLSVDENVETFASR